MTPAWPSPTSRAGSPRASRRPGLGRARRLSRYMHVECISRAPRQLPRIQLPGASSCRAAPRARPRSEQRVGSSRLAVCLRAAWPYASELHHRRRVIRPRRGQARTPGRMHPSCITAGGSFAEARSGANARRYAFELHPRRRVIRRGEVRRGRRFSRDAPRPRPGSPAASGTRTAALSGRARAGRRTMNPGRPRRRARGSAASRT